MKEGVIVRFSEEELEACRALARGRNEMNHAHGIVNRRVDPNTNDEKLNFYGIVGETAAGRVLNINIDKQLVPGGQHSGAVIIDLRYHGTRVEVKFNRYPWGDLYVGKDYRLSPDVDILILVVPVDRDCLAAIRIVGWATREEFEHNAKGHNYGHGDVRRLKQKELHSMDSFIAAYGPGPGEETS